MLRVESPREALDSLLESQVFLFDGLSSEQVLLWRNSFVYFSTNYFVLEQPFQMLVRDLLSKSDAELWSYLRVSSK